jgi:hypothetical protein
VVDTLTRWRPGRWARNPRCGWAEEVLTVLIRLGSREATGEHCVPGTRETKQTCWMR